MRDVMSFFRKKSCTDTVGIQLSADNATLLILDHKYANKPEVKGFLSLAINDTDEAEEIKLAIQNYLAEKDATDASCCLVLDDKDYQLLVIEAPNVPDSELSEAVKWKVKDLIQHPLSDVVIDAFLQKDELSNKNIANVVVAPKELVQKKAQFIEDIELNLSAIDIPELSYRNFLESGKYSDDSIALVILKEMSGKLVIIHNREVCFSRTFAINYKGGLLDELPESDIVLELQRSLDYYERQLKKTVPRKIIFCGENVLDENITDFTRESFSQEVLVEDLAGHDFSESESLYSARVMASYGASLREGLLEKGLARRRVPTVLRGMW